mmetsp:Transcript_124651/g.399338  ORF Transcript_124651/g.399338 Transcript_124651/m.399338 type:complete len:203 (+) Transcript_124651:241-849(+)
MQESALAREPSQRGGHCDGTSVPALQRPRGRPSGCAGTSFPHPACSRKPSLGGPPTSRRARHPRRGAPSRRGTPPRAAARGRCGQRRSRAGRGCRHAGRRPHHSTTLAVLPPSPRPTTPSRPAAAPAARASPPPAAEEAAARPTATPASSARGSRGHCRRRRCRGPSPAAWPTRHSGWSHRAGRQFPRGWCHRTAALHHRPA